MLRKYKAQIVGRMASTGKVLVQYVFTYFSGMTHLWVVYHKDQPPLKLKHKSFNCWGTLEGSRWFIGVTQNESPKNTPKDEDTIRQEEAKMFNFPWRGLVYVKLWPYRQMSFAKSYNEKLAPHFFKPILVVAQVGTMTYHVELPLNSTSYPLFPVSLLLATLRPHQQTSHLPSELVGNLE